ncbi:MAG TPA: hypothetical protein PKC62_01035 [Ferruginibacter sp.]|nr:hypothetical protein [Bacteroidota bacterium]MCC6692373.1 hypothetical protein [Chitinophagaceae bacterium]HMT95243.1 hypothetical protein [Ferruginibacter sp.]MBS1924521.1 hypothetical protein [Bacteroidota bacterium]HMU24147.1 hypothetical protein [Ferruginibacter sp.]
MKLFKAIIFVALIGALFVSCEKETSYEGGATSLSSGSLKSGGSGDCLPSNVNGIYKTGVTLNSSNYIDVTINVTTAGSYVVKSDTVNGMSFRGVGVFQATGNQVVRLTGAGRPTLAQLNLFTIKYEGSSCKIGINSVDQATPAAEFQLNGSPANCTGYTVNGNYVAGTTLTAANTLSFMVNVTVIGTYALSVPSVNGVLFTGSGYFATLGPQTVTLSGFGTPAQPGVVSTDVSTINASTKCSFIYTVIPSGGNLNAVFTMGGAGGSCANFSTAGTYTSGTAMNGSNTATVDAIVTGTGIYTVSSNTVNGVTFVASGSFTQTGTRAVTLTAIGTPAAAGTFTFSVTGGSTTCTFDLTFN